MWMGSAPGSSFVVIFSGNWVDVDGRDSGSASGSSFIVTFSDNWVGRDGGCLSPGSVSGPVVRLS